MSDAVMKDRNLLFKDIIEYFEESLPTIIQAYPIGYFNWLIDDSIFIAEQFSIDDVYSMRLFIQLRWDIAPGFYKQPSLAQILNKTKLSAEQRFEILATDDYADAWTEAKKITGDKEWRERFWDEQQ